MRAGNEYLFHMLVTQNLETFKNYGIKKIITTCPHGYNILKKEYKDFAKVGMDSEEKPLEYDFEVFHHSDIILDLIKNGKIKMNDTLENKITYHDSCFLGRYNDNYDKPREIIKSIPGTEVVEMSRSHDRSFCCGAGGAQMFKEPEKGDKDVNIERTEQALETKPEIIAAGCPFCNTMMTDGVKNKEKEGDVQVMDIAEMIATAEDL
jgi:Fe-S oxidoreductase